MAKPIQYVQQYVPTDMSLAQNVLGMARQDMKERNQAFDAAAAYENSAIGQAYGIETWDTEYRNKVVEGIQSKIDEVVKKRGGDYAVAGNDIAKVIMKERSNPFWNDNAKQMEAIKQYRELSRDADNEIVGDPRMSYEDIQRLKAEGKDPFALTAVKKSEVYRKSSDYFANFAKTLKNPDGSWKGMIFSDDPYTNKKMNQYYQSVLQYGFKDKADVDTFLASGPGKQAVESLLSSYPQLEGASKERIAEIIRQGAVSGIGKPEVDRVANQEFGMKPLKSPEDKSGDSMASFNLLELDKDRMDEVQRDEAILSGETTPSYGISKETPKNPWDKTNFFERQTKEDTTKEIQSKYEKKYPKLYSPDLSFNRADATKKAIELEKGYSALKTTVLAMKSKDVVENVYNSLLNPNSDEVETLTRVNDKGKKDIKSIKDIVKSFKDTGIDWKQVPPVADAYGNIFVRDADDNLYKINDRVLDRNTQAIKKETIKPIMDQLLDPNMADRDDNKSIGIPGTDIKLHVNYDKENPYDVNRRYIVMYKGDEKNPQIIGRMLPGELFQTLTEGARVNFQTVIK